MGNAYTIDVPGPTEPTPEMAGGELLYGFLADLYSSPSPSIRYYVDLLCKEWSINYRYQSKGRESGRPATETAVYQRLMSETVRIYVPGPSKPDLHMTRGELLHGFLVALRDVPAPAFRDYLTLLCTKWNIDYRMHGEGISRTSEDREVSPSRQSKS